MRLVRILLWVSLPGLMLKLFFQGNIVAIKYTNRKRIELNRKILFELKHVSCFFYYTLLPTAVTPASLFCVYLENYIYSQKTRSVPGELQHTGNRKLVSSVLNIILRLTVQPGAETNI